MARIGHHSCHSISVHAKLADFSRLFVFITTESEIYRAFVRGGYDQTWKEMYNILIVHEIKRTTLL